MLQVEDYERIRRAVMVQGKSQREASRELGHSRKTIAKALKHSSPPGYRRRAAPFRPVVGSFEAMIDAWVEEDRKCPPKQRHTGTRMHQRLRDEYGFTKDVRMDGGVSATTIADCSAAGANVFVVGSAVFKADDPVKAIQELKALAEGARPDRR